jgi:hypothetical protein
MDAGFIEKITVSGTIQANGKIVKERMQKSGRQICRESEKSRPLFM